MNWKDLVGVLERQVLSGSVTTYSEVSSWAYGVPNRNQPVRSLLVGARNHGYQKLTNRVVGTDGKLANLPNGSDQQCQQLQDEGISFDEDGRVDPIMNPPVVLCKEATEEQKMQTCILKGDVDIPLETPLYRYLSTEAFLYLLAFRRMMYSKVSEWPDSFEGTRFDFLKKAREDAEFSGILKNYFYISCWTLQTEESCLYKDNPTFIAAQEELAKNGSAAMWESYCKNGGVRIKTTLGKVESLFLSKLTNCKIFRGKVYYEPADNWAITLQTQSLVSTLMHKRVSFRSESEYRFVFLPESKEGNPRESVHVDDLFEFLDEILISPATSSNVWLSRTLYNIAANLSIQLPHRTCINNKNGEQFCRISQLYKPVSEEIGHYGMT